MAGGRIIYILLSLSIVASNEDFSSIPGHTVISFRAVKNEPCDTCPRGGKCVPRIQCPAHMRDSFKNPECHLAHGNHIGVCCTTGQSHASEMDRKQRKASGIDHRVLASAHETCKRKLEKVLEKQKALVTKHIDNVTISRSAPGFGHFQSSKVVSTPELAKIGQEALKNVFLAQELKSRQVFDNDDIQYGFNDIKVPFCPPRPTCDSTSIYASLDGFCNNLANPTWGAPNTAYARLLPPNYSDGIWRIQENANPRSIVTALLPDVHNPHPHYNQMLTQFGQFLAHDLTNAVTLTLGDHLPISCCTQDGGALPPEMLHFACHPIHLPSDDPFYSQFSQSCMNFVRTQVIPPDDCSLSYARQMNGVTHFLDLSHVYGSGEKSQNLREFSGGRLRMMSDYGRQLLPLTQDDEDCKTGQDQACFDSGDGHANQMISLVGLHTIFAREHNRICDKLAARHSDWEDEKLFLEARRIVIAVYQHIVYNEWLPIVLGHEMMHLFNLHPTPALIYSDDYDPSVNPSISSEFAVVGLRFGHSAVDGQLNIRSKEKLYESVSLPEVMFAPSRMRIKPFMDRMMEGLVHQPMQTVDPFISEALSRYMFHSGNPFGLDLASINIQRSRDHGLRSYNDYRRLIGLEPLKDFQSYPETLRCATRTSASSRLASVYGNVEALEAWPGALLEPTLPGAVVGPVFAHILAEQFSRLKTGDRFHYQHGPKVHPHAFTPAQLFEIKKVRLSRILCDNTDGLELKHLPMNAFVRAGVTGNIPLPCEGYFIPRMDLNFF